MKLVTDDEVRGALTPAVAYEAVVEALREHAAGHTGLSTPRAQFIEAGPGRRLQTKGAHLSATGVAGVRVTGERDRRSVDDGRLLLLYDLGSLLPVALMEERSLYQMRVGAQVAVAVRHLRPQARGPMAVIGSGRLARRVIEAVQRADPAPEVRVHSRTAERRDALAAELARNVPGDVLPVGKAELACRGAAVVVTISSAREPVVRGEWLGQGTLVVSAGGGWECDAATYLEADRLVVDDWEQCRQLGDLAQLSRRGIVSRDDVAATLAAVAAGQAPRCGPDERLVAVTQGLTILDVAVGRRVLDALSEEG